MTDYQANDQPLTFQAVAPDDLAFLQYTSGSTSAPKGVMVSHDNIVAKAYAMIAGTDITPEDVCVTWLPIGIDRENPYAFGRRHQNLQHV